MEHTKAFTKFYEYRASQLETPCGVTPEHKDLEMQEYYGKCKAIWDTGCAITTVHSDILEEVKAVRAGSMTINTVIGSSEFPYYFVDLLLPGGIALESHKVVAGNQTGCDVLIGMDIISMGDFAISNLEGKTTFTFRIPSEMVADFCKK